MFDHFTIVTSKMLSKLTAKFPNDLGCTWMPAHKSFYREGQEFNSFLPASFPGLAHLALMSVDEGGTAILCKLGYQASPQRADNCDV